MTLVVTNAIAIASNETFPNHAAQIVMGTDATKIQSGITTPPAR